MGRARGLPVPKRRNRGARVSLSHVITGACALMSTLLAADMEARVCPSLAEQMRARAAIMTRTSLRVCIVDGLIATFEAINFMNLPRDQNKIFYL